MKKALMALMAAAFFASCNNGSSSSSEKLVQKTQEQLVQDATDKLQNSPSVPDLSIDVKPEAFRIVKSNVNFEELKKFRTIGCDANGNPVSQLDPELKAGQNFRQQSGSSTAGKNTSLSVVNKEIVTKTNTQLKTHENYELLQNSAAPGVRIEDLFSAKPHIIGDVSLNNAGLPAEYSYNIPNVTYAGAQYYQTIYPDGELSWYCLVKYSRTDYVETKTNDEISYQLMGWTVSGYTQRAKRTGVVECSIYSPESSDTSKDINIELGLGTEESINIYTNAIVEDGSVSCGGGSAYSASKVVLQTGRVVSSRVDKTLSAPFRAQAN